MEVKVDELLDKISGHVKDLSRTETILGEEFTLGEYTVRPIIKVATGFGSGAGTGDDPKRKTSGTGGGAGAGIAVMPSGFLVTRGHEISFIGADKKGALSSLMDKVPDLVEKMADMKRKDEGTPKEKKEEKADKK